MAMNSELVGLPLAEFTVYPKYFCRVSRSPRSHATSMAWRMARSTRLGAAHIKGYQYLREAILLAVDDMDVINAVTKVLYPEVARRFSAGTPIS